MQARQLGVAAAVLLTLVVGAQLAYTTVGQPVGERWADPTTAVSTADDASVIEVAAAGDGDAGVVAWIVRSDERYAVTVVRVGVVDGRVSLGPRRTVVRDAPELQGLDVAVEGEDVALVWERAPANDVVLYRTTTGRARVVSDDPLRVLQPSVALVDGGTVVAWQQRNGSRFVVELAGVTDANVSYRTVPVATGGTGSPSVDAVGEGYALTWFDADSRTTQSAFGALGPTGPDLEPAHELGPARPVGGFGGDTGPVSVGSGADDDVVRAVWLDRVRVTTAAVSRDGSVTGPTTFGPGDRPRVAVGDGRWLAAWVVTAREADSDVAFATGEAAATSGVVSRYPSSANHPSPFYAPDAAVAWSERGGQGRVLVSGLLDSPAPRYVARLEAEPGRLAFVALAAMVLGAVTLPVMPWVFLSMLGAFYLTNRFVRRQAVRALARLSASTGRSVGEPAVRERLDAVPPAGWAAAFVAGEVALLVLLLPPVGANVSLSFAGPVALSVAAAVGTGILQLVSPRRSPWRIAAVFAYFQTAALWATALPDVL